MTVDPKHAWQSSVPVAEAPPLAEVRAGADKFYRKIRRRNLVEYAACAFVVVAFARNVVTLPHILQKVGSAWIVLAAFYAAWQLHRRGSAMSPGDLGQVPLYQFVRQQLVRQRDALKSVFWWYMLPFLPGLAMLMIGNGQAVPPGGGPPIWLRWVSLAVIVGVFAGIWWLNQLAARKLQRRIAEIDALTDT
ncbi:MAG TPA: hypothetical protein VIC34_10965 [Croceibacterium sp.]